MLTPCAACTRAHIIGCKNMTLFWIEIFILRILLGVWGSKKTQKIKKENKKLGNTVYYT
jgi:hypothetical protein